MKVSEWIADYSYHYQQFGDLEKLDRLKREKELIVSLVVPTYNERETVEMILRQVTNHLMDEVSLVDELVVVDGHSTDGTQDVVRRLKIPLYYEDEILKDQLPPARGKGEALFKSLYVTCGDIICWIDADIKNFAPHFVYGILGPLIMRDDLEYTKAFYERPLQVNNSLVASGGGRVTEIMARPLLNLFFSDLRGFFQPLSGEYAGRRELMEQVPFYTGYGVEIGLLIDIFRRCGLESMAQVDLENKVHYNQDLKGLSRMGFGILQTVIAKLEETGELKLQKRLNHEYLLPYGKGASGDQDKRMDSELLKITRRPPMAEVRKQMAAG